jgi:predicted polyphosphate/ATP-dependent NAD kinase
MLAAATTEPATAATMITRRTNTSYRLQGLEIIEVDGRLVRRNAAISNVSFKHFNS